MQLTEKVALIKQGINRSIWVGKKLVLCTQYYSIKQNKNTIELTSTLVNNICSLYIILEIALYFVEVRDQPAVPVSTLDCPTLDSWATSCEEECDEKATQCEEKGMMCCRNPCGYTSCMTPVNPNAPSCKV